MPARDSCQRIIFAALEHEEWAIVVKPPGLRREDYCVFVDVEALLGERVIYA
jgi:hypothetical protein